jgi:hypothetical protein
MARFTPPAHPTRIALGVALVIRGVLPLAGFILLPPALTLLSIDIPRVRRWRRRMIVRFGRRQKRFQSSKTASDLEVV